MKTESNYKVVFVDVDGNELCTKYLQGFTLDEAKKFALHYVGNHNECVNYKIFER